MRTTLKINPRVLAVDVPPAPTAAGLVMLPAVPDRGITNDMVAEALLIG